MLEFEWEGVFALPSYHGVLDFSDGISQWNVKPFTADSVMPQLSMDQLLNDLGPAAFNFLFIVDQQLDGLADLKIAQARARISSVSDLEWSLDGPNDVDGAFQDIA